MKLHYEVSTRGLAHGLSFFHIGIRGSSGGAHSHKAFSKKKRRKLYSGAHSRVATLIQPSFQKKKKKKSKNNCAQHVLKLSVVSFILL